MNEKESARNQQSELYSPDLHAAKYDLKRQQK